MERTAGVVFAPGLFQWHPGIDDFDNVDAVQQVIDEGLRNAAGHGLYGR